MALCNGRLFMPPILTFSIVVTAVRFSSERPFCQDVKSSVLNQISFTDDDTGIRLSFVRRIQIDLSLALPFI